MMEVDSRVESGGFKGDIDQYIKFDIADQTFGIDVLSSREIVRAEEITVIPDSPDFVKGVIDLRNEIVPIISLQERFNMAFGGEDNHKENKEKKIIIIAIDDTLLGLEVSEVEEIVKITSEEIQKAPEITRKFKKDYIKGVAKLEDSLLVILAVDRIFSGDEIEEIKGIE